MKSLDFNDHLSFFQICHQGEQKELSETLPFVIRQAQDTHSLVVMDALKDSFIRIIDATNALKIQNAVFYLRFGAGRRLKMMWDAYRNLIHIAYPERNTPLDGEETAEITRDINTIYMNIRGVLDNFAWCLLYEFDKDSANELNERGRAKVGIFSHCVTSCEALSEIRDSLLAHKKWGDEVRDRRDPVAHRIPLYVPPTHLQDGEYDKYSNKFDEFFSASEALDFEKADVFIKQLDEVGTFVPIFMHHPNDGPISLYPIMPNDVVHVIEICEIIGNFIVKK